MTKKFNKKMHGYRNQSKAFKTSMKRAERNATVRVDMLDGTEFRYGVYLDFAGQTRLLFAPQSKLLFSFLDGPAKSVGDLRRWMPGRGVKSRKLQKLVNHVLAVVDLELEEFISEAEYRRSILRPAHVEAAAVIAPDFTADLQPAA